MFEGQQKVFMHWLWPIRASVSVTTIFGHFHVRVLQAKFRIFRRRDFHIIFSTFLAAVYFMPFIGGILAH